VILPEVTQTLTQSGALPVMAPGELCVPLACAAAGTAKAIGIAIAIAAPSFLPIIMCLPRSVTATCAIRLETFMILRPS